MSKGGSCNIVVEFEQATRIYECLRMRVVGLDKDDIRSESHILCRAGRFDSDDW